MLVLNRLCCLGRYMGMESPKPFEPPPATLWISNSGRFIPRSSGWNSEGLDFPPSGKHRNTIGARSSTKLTPAGRKQLQQEHSKNGPALSPRCVEGDESGVMIKRMSNKSGNPGPQKVRKNRMREVELEKWGQTTNFRRTVIHKFQQFETGGNSKSVPIFPTPASRSIFFTASHGPPRRRFKP